MFVSTGGHLDLKDFSPKKRKEGGPIGASIEQSDAKVALSVYRDLLQTCTASTPQSSPSLPLPSSTVKLNRPVNHTTGRYGTNYLIYPCSACSSACPSFLFFRLFLNEFLNVWLLRRSDAQERRCALMSAADVDSRAPGFLRFRFVLVKSD